LVSQNLQRGRGETGEEYEMFVHYVPRSGAPIEAANRNDRPVDTAGEGNRGRERRRYPRTLQPLLPPTCSIGGNDRGGRRPRPRRWQCRSCRQRPL
jgi:hypothetical protein